MKVTKKQLQQIILEELDECMSNIGMMGGDMPIATSMPIKLSLGKTKKSKSYDSDGRMANSNVYNIMKHASMLAQLISDDDELEPWVQEKLAVATEAIETIAEYLEYEKSRGE